MSIFAGLESLESFANENEFDETNLDQDVLMAMESYIEISDRVAEIEDMIETHDAAVDTCESLENLHAVIEEVGISKHIMLAADPERSLVEYGIVPDYDELENVAVKDGVAEAALEGIADTMKKAWKKIIEFIKSIIAKLKELFGRAVGMFKKKVDVASKLIKELDGVTVDKKKAKEIKVEVPDNHDTISKAIGLITDTTGKVVDACSKVASDITSDHKGFEKNLLRDALKGEAKKGLFSAKTKSGDFSLKVTVKTKEKKLSDVDVNTTVENLKNYIKNTAGIEMIDTVAKAMNKVAETAERASKSVSEDSKAKKAGKNLKIIQRLISDVNTVLSSLTAAIDKSGTMYINIARKMISNKKSD